MKELRKLLLTEVGERVATLGFSSRQADQSFVRAFPAGKQCLHLAFIKHATDFDVTADVAIRLHALEDMINATSEHLSKREKSQTYTVGCELGNLVFGAQHRWTVTSSADVEPVANSIVEFFVGHGLPYMEEHASLDVVYDLIAPHPEKFCLHSPFIDQRAISAVGLALLLDRPEDVPNLFAGYEAELEAIYPFGVQRFKDFVAEYLRPNAPEPISER